MNDLRNKSIDSVKGLCLLHMFLLHLSIIYGVMDFQGEGASTYFHLMSFFMTPFFLFSGFFFSSRKEPKKYVIHVFRKLIIPWAFWSIVSLPVFYMYQYIEFSEVNWLEPYYMFIQIGSLASNDALWFLFSLFWVNVIFYFVDRYAKKELYKACFILLCFVYACLDSWKLPCFFSSSNISLGLVYFYLGYKFRYLYESYNVTHLRWFVLSVVVFTTISVFDPQYMMIVTIYQSKGNFILNLFWSLSGTYILWYVFAKLKNCPILSFIGKKSMTLYVWHMIPLRLILYPLMKRYYPAASYCEYILIVGGVILITTYIMDYCLSHKCPMLVGR